MYLLYSEKYNGLHFDCRSIRPATALETAVQNMAEILTFKLSFFTKSCDKFSFLKT